MQNRKRHAHDGFLRLQRSYQKRQATPYQSCTLGYDLETQIKPFDIVSCSAIFSKLTEKLGVYAELNLRLQPFMLKVSQVETVVVSLDDSGCLTLSAQSQSAVNHLTYLKRLILQELRSCHDLKDIAAKVTMLKFIVAKPSSRRVFNQATNGFITNEKYHSQALRYIEPEYIETENDIQNDKVLKSNGLQEKASRRANAFKPDLASSKNMKIAAQYMQNDRLRRAMLLLASSHKD